jgi:hypothetical protein
MPPVCFSQTAMLCTCNSIGIHMKYILTENLYMCVYMRACLCRHGHHLQHGC